MTSKGEARQFVQEGNALAVTFVLAVLIIFLVLSIQFRINARSVGHYIPHRWQSVARY